MRPSEDAKIKISQPFIKSRQEIPSREGNAEDRKGNCMTDVPEQVRGDAYLPHTLPGCLS